MSGPFPAWLMNAAADKMAEYRAVISSLKLDLGERDAHITRLESDVAIARAGIERAIKFLEGSNPLHMSGGIRNCDLRDLLGEALSRISGEDRHG